jgi:hypothetical protein
MRILVDRFIYQGLTMRQGDTPYLISSNFGLLIDQDEKGSRCCVRAASRYPRQLMLGLIRERRRQSVAPQAKC